MSDEHLDLDALADVLAEDAPQSATSHLSSCPQCQAALADLRVADEAVHDQLAALPPMSMPADVADRLAAALAREPRPAEGATVTTLPPAAEPSSSRRWLPAAAAAVLILAGAGYGLSQLGGSGGGDSSSAGTSAASGGGRRPELDVVRNDSGTDYTGRADLAAKLPQLLAGSAKRSLADSSADAAAPVNGAAPQASSQANTKAMTVADPLARLRGTTGLADCLVALLPPDDPSVRPLALDYGSYKGTPALVVVLPSALAGKLDVFVVGAGCSQANDSTLFYTSVDKP